MYDVVFFHVISTVLLFLSAYILLALFLSCSFLCFAHFFCLSWIFLLVNSTLFCFRINSPVASSTTGLDFVCFTMLFLFTLTSNVLLYMCWTKISGRWQVTTPCSLKALQRPISNFCSPLPTFSAFICGFGCCHQLTSHFVRYLKMIHTQKKYY